MAKYFLIAFCLSGRPLFAQGFAGYRTGNYTGGNGVFYNPANFAFSRY